MYPILLSWGSIILPSWHAFYALAAILGYLYLIKTNQKFTEINISILNFIYLTAYISGYFGARILSLMIEESSFELKDVFTIGSMTFYGGFIGAMISCSSIAIYHRWPIFKLIDCCIPAGIFALAVGRIGCFLNGDDYGKPTRDFLMHNPWWGVTFPNLNDQTPRIPTQLIESAFCLILSISCYYLPLRLRSKLGYGEIGLLSLAAYCLFRFGIEYLRGDERGTLFTEFLSTSQSISIILLTIIPLLWWIKKTMTLTEKKRT